MEGGKKTWERRLLTLAEGGKKTWERRLLTLGEGGKEMWEKRLLTRMEGGKEIKKTEPGWLRPFLLCFAHGRFFGTYSLEPVSISELMMVFWKQANRIMTGRTQSTEPAMTTA